MLCGFGIFVNHAKDFVMLYLATVHNLFFPVPYYHDILSHELCVLLWLSWLVLLKFTHDHAVGFYFIQC
jgi:hypothetical protein